MQVAKFVFDQVVIFEILAGKSYWARFQKDDNIIVTDIISRLTDDPCIIAIFTDIICDGSTERVTTGRYGPCDTL